MILSVKKTHLSVVEARKDIYLIKTSNIIPVKLLKIDNGHDVIEVFIVRQHTNCAFVVASSFL